MVFVVKIKVWFNMNFLRINYLCFLLLITYWTNMYICNRSDYVDVL